MLTKGQKNKLKIASSLSLVILAGMASFFVYQSKKDSQKPKELKLSGLVVIGSQLNPPRDYCENGQYLVSLDQKPLFQDKTVIQIRNENGGLPIKNISQYLKEEVFVRAIYEPNKTSCLALMCSCEDFITVKTIELRTEKTLSYLKEFSNESGRSLLNFLPAQWLTSLDGTCTMTEDKHNFPDLPECNYNGFLIVKNNQEQELALSRNLEIFMQTLNHATSGEYLWDEKISLDKLKQIIKNPGTDHERIYRNMPFWLEIEDNEIKKITEQYLP